MRRNRVAVAAFVTVIAQSLPAHAGEPAPVERVRYVCQAEEPNRPADERGKLVQPAPVEKLEVRFFAKQGVAVLVRQGATVELQLQTSGSGFRYAGKGVDMHGKGDELRLASTGRPTLTCKAQP